MHFPLNHILVSHVSLMMTTSSGNILRVTDSLWGESTGHRRFPSQRPLARSFDVFLWSAPEQTTGQSRRRWFETTSHSLWRHCDAYWVKVMNIIVYPKLFLNPDLIRVCYLISREKHIMERRLSEDRLMSTMEIRALVKPHFMLNQHRKHFRMQATPLLNTNPDKPLNKKWETYEYILHVEYMV